MLVFTVAILAQGTNRGDALCAALLCNRAGSILADVAFLKLAKRARVRDAVRPATLAVVLRNASVRL